MIELKPCPFCGSRNTSTGFAHPIYMIKRYRGKFVFAGCRDCGATTPLFYANNKTRSPLINEANEEIVLEKAAEAWNRRAE